MPDAADKALLPAGLQDILAPDAAHEAAAVERLIAGFAARGYERVKPPLMEFEEALLSGAGAAVAQQTFRLMDPVSQRMLALRADMTPQVARIAATRMAKAPRPLRLCYGGQVLQVRGTQLRPERQFGQVGAELIGAEAAEADAEVVLLAVEALVALGVENLAVDLSQPTLVSAVAEGLGFEPAIAADLRQLLDRKDAGAVNELSGDRADLLLALLRAAGPAERALATLAKLTLPKPAKAELDKLAAVARLIAAAAPGLALTVDPVEHRGFEYQTGVSFTIFARGVRGELGRGGRYLSDTRDGHGEPATGFSLFMDTVLRALPAPQQPARLYLPHGTDPARAAALRAEGWITLAGLAAATDVPGEARRLGCSHVLRGGKVEPVGD